jgi:hypothetical protein
VIEQRLVIEARMHGDNVDDASRESVRAILSDRALDAVETKLADVDSYVIATVVLRSSGVTRARELLERLLAAFGQEASGAVYVPGISGPPLPFPFERVEWWSAVYDETYDIYFTREQLLGTPAVAVEERDGRMWIEFYADPFAPKPDELEHTRGYLRGLLAPPDPTPPDRMAGPLPAVGDIQNRIELREEVAGAMFNGIHRGWSTVAWQGKHERLLTSASGIAKGLDEWFRRDLKYTVDGVTECITAECFEAPSGPISVLVEVCPAGRPVAERAPMTQAETVSYLRTLLEVVAAAHRRGRTLAGIHPLTCYADERGVLTTIAPRALPFLLAVPPMRGGLCLADAYAPAEIWRERSGSTAGDVFSLCALGLFLFTGRHPYPANGDPNRALAAVINGAPPATPPNALDAILRPGLDRDPDNRPTIEELRARLA